MWRKYAVIALALLAVCVDFVSSAMSIGADLLILGSLIFVVWPLLFDGGKDGK